MSVNLLGELFLFEAQRVAEVATGLLDRLTEFYAQTDKLFSPYMRLHQKLTRLWWPFDWRRLPPTSNP
jgi:hypothetical protein